MEDRTVVARSLASGLAYLFWVTGQGRGSYVRLSPDGTTFGTGPRADTRLDDEFAAGEQGRIRREGEDWFLYDLAGGGTTMIDNQAVYRSGLSDGARVTLGRSVAVFRIVE